MVEIFQFRVNGKVTTLVPLGKLKVSSLKSTFNYIGLAFHRRNFVGPLTQGWSLYLPDILVSYPVMAALTKLNVFVCIGLVWLHSGILKHLAVAGKMHLGLLKAKKVLH